MSGKSPSWLAKGKVTGGQRQQVPITLTTLEFTRRWALHILPKGYTKARRFGGWSNRRTSEYIERCALLLDAADVKLAPQAMHFDPHQWELELESQTELTQAECPHCGAPNAMHRRPRPNQVGSTS
jgi:hypothetical protein